MRTLHRYLTRQVLATLVMTVAVFTAVLLLGNMLKEILMLLISHQASLGLVAEAFGLLIPWVLAFALPMGMLTAALLVFGRFSADQELTAVRSSGISLVALISPILALSLALCGLCAVVNMEIAPRCRVIYLDLINRMRFKIAAVVLPEGRFIRDIKPYLIYVGRNDGHNLKDVAIYELDDKQKLKSFTFAAGGELDTTNIPPMLYLKDVHRSEILEDGTLKTGHFDVWPETLGTNAPAQTKQKPSLSDMTFPQLQAELADLEQSFSLPTSPTANNQALRQLLQQIAQQKRDRTQPVRVQIHRQVAFSFACFGFTLVGIPLGIRAHRRETNVGVFMALMLVAVYYSFIIVGQSLETRPELAPHLIVWIPNFIFQAAGAVMLWRANKGI